MQDILRWVSNYIICIPPFACDANGKDAVCLLQGLGASFLSLTLLSGPVIFPVVKSTM